MTLAVVAPGMCWRVFSSILGFLDTKRTNLRYDGRLLSDLEVHALGPPPRLLVGVPNPGHGDGDWRNLLRVSLISQQVFRNWLKSKVISPLLKKS